MLLVRKVNNVVIIITVIVITTQWLLQNAFYGAKHNPFNTDGVWQVCSILLCSTLSAGPLRPLDTKKVSGDPQWL